MIIKKIVQYKVFLILFGLLIFTTIISTYNPFKINLLAADNVPACISTCTDYTGNYYGDCERFCDPYSAGYYGYDNSCAYQSYGGSYTEEWCSYVEFDREMCVGGCIAENPGADSVESSCGNLCSSYGDTASCVSNAEWYLLGEGFTPSISFCSYLDFRDEVGLCYSACTTELGGGYETECSTFCNPADYGYYGYDWKGSCAGASESNYYTYPQPGLWCSHLETNSEMCTGACMVENSLADYPDSSCNSICTSYTLTSECVTYAVDEFEEGFTPTTDFCSYLEYGEDEEPLAEDGIYFDDAVRSYMEIGTGGVQYITGYVQYDNLPDSFEISGTGDEYYYNNLEEDCTIAPGAEPDIWEFSCPTDNITEEGIYQYGFYTSHDADLWESYKTLTMNYGVEELTYLWTFDEETEGWGNEIINNIAPTSGNATHQPMGFWNGGAFDGLAEKYLTFQDTNGDFNFAGENVHFKAEAMISGPAYDTYDRMLLSKKSQGGESLIWTMGTSGDRGVKCSVIIDDQQYTTQTEGELGGQLTNGDTYKIGCEWNSYTRELTAHIDDVPIKTNVIGGSLFIPTSTNDFTINGIPGVGYDMNAYIDNIMIYSYPAGNETNSPGIYLSTAQKFKLVDSTNTTPILGTVFDDSAITSVEIKRTDSETWNSCTVDSEPTGITLPSPFAKWSLEEESGEGAYLLDSSGNGYHAFPIDTTVGEGIVGNARTIGNWKFIEVDSSTGINDDIPSGSEARTISAWVKLETTEGCPTGQNPIFSYGSEGEKAAWGLVVNCQREIGIHEGSFEEYISSSYVPSWEWTFLTVSMDSNGNKTHYINGENVGTLTSVPNTVPTSTPKIGAFYNEAHYFPGTIDEVSLFSRALTEEEVIDVYRSARDNYEFTCFTGPRLDLSTTAYQIRGTDEFNNVTALENYGYADVETDAFGGLELKTLLRFESGSTLVDTIGTAINGYAYEGGINPITSIPTTPGIYGQAGDFQSIRRLFFPDNAQFFDFNDEEGKLPHFKVEAMVKRLYEDTDRSIVVKTLSEDGFAQWKVGTSNTSNLLCSVITLGGTVSVISDEVLPIDEWRTVGCDWNALTGELTASIDGANVKTVTTDIDISLRQFDTSTGPLVIGGMGQDSYYDPFDGPIDNVKIYSEYFNIPDSPVVLNNSSVLATSATYVLQGTVNTNTSDEIVQVQYREYVQGQLENANWIECTCVSEPCDSPTEEFSCSITNIPQSSTTTYEIRYGYGDPVSYLASNSYGIFDITRDSTNSLEAWWSFDKATEVIDYSVNELNGTLNGAGAISLNPITGSVTNVFDGDTYFEVPDTSGLLNFNSEDSQFTVDMWIKPDVGLNSNQDYHVMYKNAPDSSFAWGIKIFVTLDGDYNIRGLINSNGSTKQIVDYNPNAYLTPGDWNHVVFSFANVDSTATIKVNDNNPDVYSNDIYFLIPTSSSPLTIGANPTGGNKFEGEIGDIKIYSSADARAPQVTFTDLDNSERITNNPNQEFEITVTDQTGVESFGYFFFPMAGSWDVEAPDYIDIRDREWIYVENPTEGNWGDKEVVIRINAVNLSDSIWYLYTRASDLNNFESLLPTHWWYTTYGSSTPSSIPFYQFYVEAQDTTPPQIFAHSIIPRETVDTNPGVRGYVKDNESDTTSDIASMEYKVEKGALVDEVWVPEAAGTWIPITPLGTETIFDSTTEEFYIRLETLVPGDYKLEIRAADAAGNSTEDNDTNHSEIFTIYEIDPKPDTTVLIKEEDFDTHELHDQLFSDGVWGNGILRLRQKVDFTQTQEFFSNNNDFGYKYGEYRGSIWDSIDGNLWVVNNDFSFSYYDIDTKEYTRYSVLKNGDLKRIDEIEFGGDRYLMLDYEGTSGTVIYDINNTPENINDDDFVDYANKAGFADYQSFRFINTDTRNGKFALFAQAEPAEENFVIWIDTKGTIMDLSDDTYVTWGVADNLFYNETAEEYHTVHDFVGVYFDQELDTFIVSSYTTATWVCSDGGDPTNKTNDECKYYSTWGKYSIIKDDNGYYWLGGNGRLVRIDSKNSKNVLDDTLYDVIPTGDPRITGDTISDMIIIPGTYPVGDELWFITSNGYIRGIEYNFTYDDELDDTTYVYTIPNQMERTGFNAHLALRGDNTFYITSQEKGLQKIALTRSFEPINTIEMLPIPPDGVLAINYIDLEEVLGSVTNGSQYTLNDLVTYEVSNDSGVTWYPITQGNRVSFPTPDYKLKLKMTLRSGSSPIIDLIKLSYITYAEQTENSCDIKINNEAPVIVNIQPNTNQSFTVTFAPLTSETIQTYTLEYGPSSNSFTSGTQTVSSTTNTFNVTNIEIGKEYFFRVKANSDCTSSLWSNVLSATNNNQPQQPAVTPPTTVPKGTTPSTTTNLCGNGILDEGEQCDYANTQTYMCEDGSTGICTIECTFADNSCEEEEDTTNIPIIDKIKDDIRDVEKDRDGEGISAANVANWAVKLISLSLLTLSVPLIPYYLMRGLVGILYIIGKRNRDKEYGYVYDSVTKEPVKQAIVRIYSGDKLVHTDVTGMYGEFGGNIEPGIYTLFVQKPQYSFPSSRIAGSTDMHITNVYNGRLEILDNTEVITAVPIDNNKAKVFDIFKTIVINRASILLQFVKLLLFVGLLAYSIYAYKTNSTILNLVVLVEYGIVGVLLLFSSLGRDIKYGKITNPYDEPVVGLNIGLFEREFGKLQAERITNEKGQYRFIIKPGTYEIRSLTPSYTLQQENVLTVKDKPSIINHDLKITNSR